MVLGQREDQSGGLQLSSVLRGRTTPYCKHHDVESLPVVCWLYTSEQYKQIEGLSMMNREAEQHERWQQIEVWPLVEVVWWRQLVTVT